MNILVDSNFLFSLLVEEESNHKRTAAVMKKYRHARFITIEPVITETAYLVRKQLSQPKAVKFVQAVAASNLQIQPLTKADLVRAASIMERYAAADFDLADASLMALTERMSITHVATYDRRDFGQFKPIHCNFLTLLPE
jgi:predicted nucleic acid-binding protein